MSHYKLE